MIYRSIHVAENGVTVRVWFGLGFSVMFTISVRIHVGAQVQDRFNVHFRVRV